MKRLFSNTILAALIISLVPAQSAQATNNWGSLIGAVLLGGVIGKMVGDYARNSYREKAATQVKGLTILTETADRDFDNASYSRNAEDLRLGEEGSWTEESTNGYIFGLGLPKNESHDLIRKVKTYRKNLGTPKRAATKKELIDTCNKHKEKIQSDETRNRTWTQYGYPTIGAVLGLMYGWLGSK